MPSIYSAGALEARDIAEMTNVNSTDVDSAAKLAGVIADNDAELAAGMATKVTSQTTLVIAHSFTAAPDFLLVVPVLKGGNLWNVAANTTAVTVTRTTATSSWSVAYVIGYTA
jgi:hypothetical protein